MGFGLIESVAYKNKITRIIIGLFVYIVEYIPGKKAKQKIKNLEKRIKYILRSVFEPEKIIYIEIGFRKEKY